MLRWKLRVRASKGVVLRWWLGRGATLAQRSAEAAKEIENLDLATASPKRSRRAVSWWAKPEPPCGTSSTQAQQVSTLISDINEVATEQTAGIRTGEPCRHAARSVTQQNAALVEESASAADSLNQQARQLVQAVAAFKLEDARGGVSVARAKPATDAGAAYALTQA